MRTQRANEKNPKNELEGGAPAAVNLSNVGWGGRGAGRGGRRGGGERGGESESESGSEKACPTPVGQASGEEGGRREKQKPPTAASDLLEVSGVDYAFFFSKKFRNFCPPKIYEGTIKARVLV
jgi:hypothetical protein